MRILFLSTWFPYPPDNGSKIRVYNLLKSLAPKHEVTLLSFISEDFDARFLEPIHALCPIVHTTPITYFQPLRWRALLGFLSPRPRSLVDTYSPAMANLVQAEVARSKYDALIASEMGAAVYVQNFGSIPRIFEDVELGAYRAATSNRNWKSIARRLTWFKFAWFVRNLTSKFDLSTVVSKEEQAALATIANRSTRIAIVPNGIDCGYYGEQPVKLQPDTLLFNGALTYSANRDAAEYFLTDIWPLIKTRLPQAQLKITGRRHSVALKGVSIDNGVTLTGYLDDIRPAIQSSMVTVVPMRIGGGTRVKILEAMALGTPVVSTTKGAEGLEVTHGENVLIADEPAEFAALTCDVLEKPELRRRLGENGRRLVQTRYDWNPIGQQFESLLKEIVSGRGT